jgi:hypothetical protein
VTQISTLGYMISGASSASTNPTLTWQPTFGTVTNSNSTNLYRERQLELVLRLRFWPEIHCRPPQIALDSSTGFNFGKQAFLERAAYPKERRIQIADTVTYLHDNHSIKFGADYNRVLDYINNLYNGNGSYTYRTLGGYIADYDHATQGLGPANYTGNYSGFSQSLVPRPSSSSPTIWPSS